MAPGLLADVLEKAFDPETMEEALNDQTDTDEEHDVMDIDDDHVPQGASETAELGGGGENQPEDRQTEQKETQQHTTARLDPILTPPDTPPASLFAAFIRGCADKQASLSPTPNIKTKCQPWEYAFHAAQKRHAVLHVGGVATTRLQQQREERRARQKGQKQARRERKTLRGKPPRTGKFLSRKQVDARLWKGERIHRRELEPAPDNHWDIANHSMRDAFLQAERDHLASHDKMRS